MIKVAVIGVGSMGRNHARVYSQLDEVKLVAVADCKTEIAEAVSGQYRARAYQDHSQLLKNERPDAVSIAVPTALHEQIAVEALEAGAHVLVEKPIAATLDGGKRMIEAAAYHHRRLMVGHIVRFNPAIQTLQRKLQAGELGRLYQIVCRRIGPFPARIRDVGVVVDLATHDIDLMRYLTGNDPVRVFAETERRIHTDHEDLILGLLRFPDGLTGALEINWLTPTKVREVLVLGERGLFRVDDLTQDLFFYENRYGENELWSALQAIKGVSEGSMIRYAIKRFEPLQAELQAFISAIKEHKPMPVTGEDGLAALELALALVKSGQTNQVVRIDHESN
jgi:UDP-N-acetylglucosamine 3-dehydrogenase